MKKRLRLYCIIGLFLSALIWTRPVSAAPLGVASRLDQIVHVVQPGQNLFRIALRYGTSVEAIMAANGLTNSRTIYVGQRLVIPQGSGALVSQVASVASGGSYAVQRGDTLTRIALRHGVTVTALMRANGIANPNAIYAGQRLVIPGAGGVVSAPAPATAHTYVVRPGDSLSKIAQRFGITTATLARLNGIVNPSAIYAGQVLRLSGAAPAVSAGGSKRIVVDLSEQHLYAYQGNRLVYSFVASSGAAPSYTRTGEFRVQSKIPRAYGSAWNIWMPNWLGIYWAGSTENGIHALPILPNGQTLWAGYLGRPVSYGCIVLGTYEAQLLYNWAEIGTPVSIRY
jgi:LysM repeat protein